MNTTPYCDVALVKKILNITATDRDARVALAADAATQAINLAMDTDFHVPGETAADEERFYTSERPSTIQIDDLVELHEVAVDSFLDGSYGQVWEEGRDFALEPLNALAKGRPFERIKLLTRSRYSFSPRQRAVRVTGVFGWPVTPPAVVEYATILAVKLYKRPDAAFGIATFGDVSMQVMRNDPDFDNLLHSLGRDTIIY